jgi:hypothetical protein
MTCLIQARIGSRLPTDDNSEESSETVQCPQCEALGSLGCLHQRVAYTNGNFNLPHIPGILLLIPGML